MANLRHTALCGNWLWIVLLSVALIVLGALALWAVALGALLLVSGIAEGIGAGWSWGWSGFFLYLGWPATRLWVLGLFLGISLIFRVFNWLGLGLALRTLPRSG